MERIKRSQLDHLVTELNKALGTPTESINESITGNTGRCNVGHIGLDKNISGFKIEQTTGVYGGTHVLGHEHRMTARECWMALRCMVDAVAIAKPVTPLIDNYGRPTYDCTVIRDGREDKPSNHFNFTLPELLNEELKPLAMRTDVVSITISRFNKDARAAELAHFMGTPQAAGQ